MQYYEQYHLNAILRSFFSILYDIAYNNTYQLNYRVIDIPFENVYYLIINVVVNDFHKINISYKLSKLTITICILYLEQLYSRIHFIIKR